MKKKRYFCAALILIIVFSSCAGTGKKAKKLVNYMTEPERNSIVFGPVSPKQRYYHEVADVAQYIQEMSVYDEELEATYIVHITLPPDYNEKRAYPMYMMTDGIWRLSDHAELRPMMVNREIEDIIMVSIGLDYEISDGLDRGNEEAHATLRLKEFVAQADLFLDFITNNLAPYMGELYHIDYNRSALIGHSFGGYFMHYAIFSMDKYENQPFHYYVMASPSNELIVARHHKGHDFIVLETDYFKKNKTLTKEIYVNAGEKEDDEGYRLYGNNYKYYAILTSIENFRTRMEEQKVKTIEYEIWEGADHSSYVKPMLRKSLLKYYGIK